jgi:DNA-binding XRE family transcriptional regulator
MKRKLRSLLRKFGHTQNELAEMLGITYQSLSIKMNGRRDFSQSEIYMIITMYSLTGEEVIDIFFNMYDRISNNSKEAEEEIKVSS